MKAAAAQLDVSVQSRGDDMRSDNLPTLTFTDEITGHGELVRRGRRLHLPRFRIVHSPLDDAGTLSVEAVVPQDPPGAVDWMLAGPGVPSVEGHTFEGSVRIPKLFWRELKGGHLTGEAPEVLTNWESLPAEPTEQYVTLALTATELALPEKGMLVFNYTGEIDDSLGGFDNPPVTWRTPLGEMRLVRHYWFRNVLAGDSAATVRLPNPALVLTLDEHCRARDVSALSVATREAAHPALRVISLLSRRHVHVRSVRIDSKFNVEHGHDFRTFRWLQSGYASTKRAGVEMMVNPHRMGATGMSTLLAELAQSPYRDDILSAAEYPPSASQARHIESQLLFGFTGLETIVNGIHQRDGTDRMFDRHQFEQVRRRIRDALSEATSQGTLPPDALTRLEAKLGELNRPPVASQIVAILQRFKVPCDDLFAPGTEPQEGIREMYRTRNRFLHAGWLKELEQVVRAATRATILTERILGAMIGLDREWMDFRGEENVRYLAATEARIEGTA